MSYSNHKHKRTKAVAYVVSREIPSRAQRWLVRILLTALGVGKIDFKSQYQDQQGHQVIITMDMTSLMPGRSVQ